MITTIAQRELRSLFLSPLAWVILAVVQFISAYLFLGQIDNYLAIQTKLATMEHPPGVTELVVTPLLSSAAILMLLVTPLLTMGLFSEERRQGTLPLLLSAPLSMSEIVLGKYLGLLCFYLPLLLLLALMPLSLLMAGSLDFGLFASAMLGLALTVAAFGAAGLYISCLSAQPTVAAVATFGVLMVLWVIDWAGGDGANPDRLIAYLSIQRHYETLLHGLVRSSDLAYFLLFIATFLILTIRRLDAERLQE